jgi:hypothetical protein
MKTLLTLIAVFALTATCYADVTVDVVDNGDGTGTVQITALDPGSVPVGIGLIVDAAAGDTVDAVTGVAKPGSAFFDVYIDWAHDDPNTYGIGDGHPGANPSVAGVLSAGGVVSLSMGELDADDANDQGLPIDLAIIDLGGAGDICLSLDDLRGGMVHTDGSAMTVIYDNDLGGCAGGAGRYAITDAPPECFPNTAPYAVQYADWVLMGKPDCWCGPFHCDGDANNATQGFGGVRVGSVDLNLVLDDWLANFGTIINPCADMDHKKQGFGGVRVGSVDLNLVLDHWLFKAGDMVGDCPRPD